MTDTTFQYPNAPQEDIVDDYHGTPVKDPYRWLEDPATPQSREWTSAQNKLCDHYLQGELRPRIQERLKEVCSYMRQSAPVKRGNRYFFWRHDGVQNQPVMCWQNRFTETPHTLLNPNSMSEKGLISVANAVPSRDGEKLAYSLSHSGSDWQEIRIRKVQANKREDYPEVLLHTKFAGIAWHPKNNGFFYNRYPDPSTVSDSDRTYYNRVYWHRLGTEQDDDVLIYERPDQKDFDFWPQVSEDGKYLILTVYLGTDRRNRIYYRPLEAEPSENGEDFVRLLDTADAHYRFLGCQNDRFFFFTDKDAPRGRVVAIDLKAPEPENWETLIPETEDALNHIILAGQHFISVYLHHASHRLYLHALDGKRLEEIQLPALGSVDALNGKAKDDEVFLSFSSFVYPGRVYLYNLKARDLDDVFIPEVDVNPEDYVTRQIFCSSKDGTQVPIFLVHRKDIEAVNRPTLMYGYGGFRNAMTPNFSATLLPWLEQGNVYALVNLRGGLEYGTQWYQAGTLERKQNVFDDFQAAGKQLIHEGISHPKKLAIRGGSNGGLLVGACLIQAPELFGAAVCQVPVLDMLRYHRFTIGRYWVSDYGNAEENPEHFKFLSAYSPLHNVQAGVDYPPLLLTTADHDDRVVPAHAKKFAATLQAVSSGKNPILLRVDTNAGHGRGKPMSKVIDEYADIYTFLARALELEWQSS